MFVAGAHGGPSGFYGCPSQNDLCIVAEGLAYLDPGLLLCHLSYEESEMVEPLARLVFFADQV